MKIHDRHRSRQDEFSSAATALQPRIAGIAIDLGDKWSRDCSIDEKGDIAAEGRPPNDAPAFSDLLARSLQYGLRLRLVLNLCGSANVSR